MKRFLKYLAGDRSGSTGSLVILIIVQIIILWVKLSGYYGFTWVETFIPLYALIAAIIMLYMFFKHDKGIMQDDLKGRRDDK